MNSNHVRAGCSKRIPASHLAWAVARLLVIAGLLAGAHVAQAATVRTWTGASATSGNWTSAANWANGVPVAGDVLNFVDTGARRASNTNNYPAGTVFSTINLFGTGWILRGNSVTISNYVAQGAPSGTSRVDLDLIASGPGEGLTLRTFATSDRLTLNGDVQLGARTLRTEGPGDFVVAGVISGSGGVFKANSGELSLVGLGANTYTGDTVVGGGVLRLGRYNFGGGLVLVGTTAVPGDLFIGGFSSTLVGDVVALERDNQIANTSVVRVNATGSLELGAASDEIGALELRGGTVTSGDGVLSVDGAIVAAPTQGVAKDSVIGGRLSLGLRGDPAQLFDVAENVQLFVTAEVSGVTTADLVKTNRGELWLTRSNTFGGDVVVGGGRVVVSDGWALGSTGGVTRLTLGRLEVSGTFGLQESLDVPGPAGALAVAAGNPSWLGPVQLGDDLSIMVPANSVLTILGAITGPAGWTKLGDGILQFKTANTNTYGGTSWVREGGFIMDGVFNQPVIPGPFIIGNATDPTNSTRAWAIKQNQVADTAPVTVNRSGVLDLTGTSDAVGPITFNGGAIETGTGTLTLNGDILVNATNETARLFGRVALGGAVRTVYTLGASNTPDLVIGALIADGGAPGGLHKVGEGSLRLSGANTFNGPVLVTDGQLRVAHPNALGTAVGGTEVSGGDGARLVLEAAVGMTIAAEPLTLNSIGPGSPIVLENFTGSNTWAGPVALLAEENVIHVPSPPRPLSLAGAVVGAGGLRKTGAGQLRLTGAPPNTYAGLTVVAEGDLILDKPGGESVGGNLMIGDGVGGANADRVIVMGGGDEIANGSRVSVQSSGQLVLEGVLDLVGSLEGSGHVLLNGLGSGLVVGRNDLSTTFAGIISGQGGFEKVGKGTLTLAGANTYAGETGATEGTLVVNGSIASSALVSINRPLNVPKNPAGVLAGTGTVPRIFPYPGGIVAPGAGAGPGAGRLTVQGHADLANDDLRLELNGVTPATGHDQLRVQGNVNLNNTRLLFTVGFAPTTNDAFVVVDKTTPGPVVGTFQNAPEGAILGSGFHKYRISYMGGDGNDVVLRRVEVPASQLTGIQPQGGNGMQIAGQGVPFATYVLEFTPQLEAPQVWTAIATNVANAQGLYEFVDAFVDGQGVPHPARFYRVATP